MTIDITIYNGKILLKKIFNLIKMAALKSATLFASMEPFLKTQGADMVKKVNAVFFFEIAKAKGDTPECWTIDLKNGTGVLSSN